MGMGPTAAAPTSRYKQRSSTPGVGYGAHSYDKQPGKGGAAPGGKGGTGSGSLIGTGIAGHGMYQPGTDPKQISQPGGPGGQMPGKGGAGPGMGGQLPPGGNYSDDGNWYQPPMPTAPDGMAQAQVMPQPIWVGQGQPPAGFTPGLGWGLGGGAGGLSPGDVLGRIRPSPRGGGMQQPVTDTTALMQKKYGNQLGGPGGPADATGPAPAIEARPTINRDPRNQAIAGPGNFAIQERFFGRPNKTNGMDPRQIAMVGDWWNMQQQARRDGTYTGYEHGLDAYRRRWGT